GKKEPHFFWISDQSEQLLADLRDSYLIDCRTGDGNYRYYPRVIRAYFDAWSRREGQAKYESHIARLIWEYIDHTEGGNDTAFKFNPRDGVGMEIERHNTIVDAFRFIQHQVRRICHSDPDRFDFP